MLDRAYANTTRLQCFCWVKTIIGSVFRYHASGARTLLSKSFGSAPQINRCNLLSECLPLRCLQSDLEGLSAWSEIGNSVSFGNDERKALPLV